MGNLEILAPVGSFKNLKLAINSGANAVYFGVKGFNARAKAENIDLKDLRDFVKLAHLHNVKTYMTLNTLIKNEEINDVLNIVDVAIDSRVDAFIVQDIGLATILLNNYKNIVLHASTQMGIHNLAGARVLENMGFKRVVLSRETKLNDIIDIKENTNLEIEYFVQGALCVAFSGNCYFSSLCFGESGNRGKCLQPCRMLYDAIKDNKIIKEGYLLSTRDLCYLKNMETLKKAGVTSFKIEGRLRREAYLIQAVSSYSKLLNGNVDIDGEIKKLKKVFSRGDYNYGYYLNGNDNIIEPNLANHRGERIGVVEKFYPFKDLYKVELLCRKKLSQGDGLKIVDGNKELSLGVGNVETGKNGIQIIYTKHKPIKGDVYLALDSEYEQKLIGKDKKLPLKIKINAKENQVLKIDISYGKIHSVTEGDVVCERAKNQPVSINDFIEIFNRIKDTEFQISSIDFDIDNVFISKSNINKIKNLSILDIENKILNFVEKDVNMVKKIGVVDINYDAHDSMGDINANFIYCKTPLKMDNFCKIFSPEVYNLKIVKNFIKQNNGEYIYLNLPIVSTKEEVEIIDLILNSLKGKIGIVVNNYWHLKYIKDFNFIVGANMNILNNFSAKFYLDLGAKNYIRSIENHLIGSLKGGLGYEGNPVVMTMCHCPFKVSCGSTCDNCTYSSNLTYRLHDGKTFSIRRYKIINCYFELVMIKKITSKSKYKAIDMR